jgi:peptidoglycan/xylan/chitin deacetylase (PgdA/CDA1 family)
MNPGFKNIVKRIPTLLVPALLWAFWKRFAKRPIRVDSGDIALAGAALAAWWATERFGPLRLGFRRALSTIPAAIAYRSIALTFDGSPDSRTTPAILDALRNAGAKATFFVKLDKVVRNLELIHRIASEGHTIGIGWLDTEPVCDRTSKQIVQALKMARRELGEALPEARYFRPPAKRISPSMQRAVGHLDMTIVTWSVEAAASLSEAGIVRHVLHHAGQGAIVRLFDANETTAAALPALLSRLKGRGYHLIRL